MEAGACLLAMNQELMLPFLFGCASDRLTSQNGSYLQSASPVSFEHLVQAALDQAA